MGNEQINNSGKIEKIEEALKESEFNLNLLIKSPHPTIVINPDTSIRYVSPALEKMTGFSSQELVGKKSPYPWWTKETVQKTVIDLEKAMCRGANKLEELFQKKNGERFFVEITSVPVKINGKFKYYLANWVDITERKRSEQALKKSEEKYRTLYDSSRDAIMTLAPPSWDFTAGNPSTIKMFKCKDEKDFASRTPFELSPEYQLDGKSSKTKALEMINKAMKDGSNFFEWTHKRVDGNEFLTTVLLTKVELEKGKPFLQATVRDITDRKKAEAEKHKLQQQLKEYTKKLERKVERLENGKIKLNQKEKLVLTALTCHPHYHDQQLAQATNLKRSTVTAIRNRLKADHWFKKIYLPNLDILGYEVLTCFYLKDIKQVNKNKTHITNTIKNSPTCLFSQFSDSFAFSISFHSNITQTYQAFQTALSNIKLEGLTEKIKQTQFFLPITSFVKFFDYSNILENLFNLEFKQEKSAPPPSKKLSQNEKELVYAFTKFPEANNQKIQELTRFSKPTIIKIKKKLFSQGYLQQVIIPNIKKLGFSFSSMIYHRLNKPILNKKPQVIQLAQQSKNSYLSLIGDKQILILSVYQDYHQLEKISFQKKNIYQKMFQTLETPEIYSFQEPKTAKLDFSALVKQAFDLDLDY